MFSKYKKKILLWSAVGALVFLGFSIYADLDKLLEAFASFNWWFFPLILALSFMNYIIRFAKWEYYRKILKIQIETKVSFLIFLSAFVMSVTPGKSGEVLKSFLLKEENGTPLEKSAPILLVERLTDFLSVVLLCIAGAFVFDYGKGALAVIGFTFAGLALVLSSRKISLYFISLLEKIKPIAKRIHKLHTAYESIYQLVRFKPLVYATLISAVGWFFECIGFYIVLQVFSSTTNIEVSILTATFIYGFSTLIGAVAIVPGGLGVTEASLTALLELLKIPKGVSVASTMIIRVATLWFAVIVGIVAVYFYQRYTNKKIM